MVRLDSTDALYVDIVHTNGKHLPELGLGMLQPIGHVDFYPNGGQHQPGCSLNSVGNIFSLPSCSHDSSCQFFIDSIKNTCNHTSYACDSEEEFNKGNCLQCSARGCNRMGYWSSPFLDLGTCYLTTNSFSEESCCKRSFRVQTFSGDYGSLKAKGDFHIYFQTSNETSSIEVLDKSETVFESLSNKTFLTSFSGLEGRMPIRRVFVSYVKNVADFFHTDKWIFKHVQIFSGDEQRSTLFCPIAASFFKSSQFYEYSIC